MKNHLPRVFVSSRCTLGEGPFWYAGCLWWVDIEESRLLTVDADGGGLRRYELPSRIGCAVPITPHRFVVALEDGFCLLDLDTGEVRLLAKPETSAPMIRFNDGKCDPAGRLLAGTLHMAGTARQAHLYLLEAGCPVRTLLDSLSISNGLAWSADHRTFYHVDTPTFSVQAYDYDVPTGSLSNPRTIIQIPHHLGYPDGMDIDRDGNLWIAHWDGWAVRCWSPEGVLVDEIRLPCARPTSCCFGGADLDLLFITSASVGLSKAELLAQPDAGSVFVCNLAQRGYPVREYALGT